MITEQNVFKKLFGNSLPIDITMYRIGYSKFVFKIGVKKKHLIKYSRI